MNSLTTQSDDTNHYEDTTLRRLTAVELQSLAGLAAQCHQAIEALFPHEAAWRPYIDRLRWLKIALEYQGFAEAVLGDEGYEALAPDLEAAITQREQTAARTVAWLEEWYEDYSRDSE